MIKKSGSSRFSLHKSVHLKFFLDPVKNVHLQGPCSLRPCISRPYGTWYQIGTYNHFSRKKFWSAIYISVNAIKIFNSDVIWRFQNWQYKRYILDCKQDSRKLEPLQNTCLKKVLFTSFFDHLRSTWFKSKSFWRRVYFLSLSKACCLSF